MRPLHLSEKLEDKESRALFTRDIFTFLRSQAAPPFPNFRPPSASLGPQMRNGWKRVIKDPDGGSETETFGCG
ncbi:Hypothetical protein NTJ_09994 [Nesidiocoris tenuis]|uniref:Uncharacterized protein n=1 Tax=Nesidiocoris tenuis TaxID=355587 RepID=A0ABN7AYB6_9HEMI|nr:Hypothetical protein NTJ_09994 [Nesidiocoris tenuis]